MSDPVVERWLETEDEDFGYEDDELEDDDEEDEDGGDEEEEGETWQVAAPAFA